MIKQSVRKLNVRTVLTLKTQFKNNLLLFFLVLSFENHVNWDVLL